MDIINYYSYPNSATLKMLPNIYMLLSKNEYMNTFPMRVSDYLCYGVA